MQTAPKISIAPLLSRQMIGSKAGLGFLLMPGNETRDINLILASVIVLSLMGLALYLAVSLADT